MLVLISSACAVYFLHRNWNRKFLNINETRNAVQPSFHSQAQEIEAAVEEEYLQNDVLLQDYEEIDEVSVSDNLNLPSSQENEIGNISQPNSSSSSLSDDGYLHPYNNLIHNSLNSDELEEDATDKSDQDDQERGRNGGYQNLYEPFRQNLYRHRGYTTININFADKQAEKTLDIEHFQ